MILIDGNYYDDNIVIDDSDECDRQNSLLKRRGWKYLLILVKTTMTINITRPKWSLVLDWTHTLCQSKSALLGVVVDAFVVVVRWAQTKASFLLLLLLLLLLGFWSLSLTSAHSSCLWWTGRARCANQSWLSFGWGDALILGFPSHLRGGWATWLIGAQCAFNENRVVSLSKNLVQPWQIKVFNPWHFWYLTMDYNAHIK